MLGISLIRIFTPLKANVITDIFGPKYILLIAYLSYKRWSWIYTLSTSEKNARTSQHFKPIYFLYFLYNCYHVFSYAYWDPTIYYFTNCLKNSIFIRFTHISTTFLSFLVLFISFWIIFSSGIIFLLPKEFSLVFLFSSGLLAKKKKSQFLCAFISPSLLKDTSYGCGFYRDFFPVF